MDAFEILHFDSWLLSIKSMTTRESHSHIYTNTETLLAWPEAVSLKPSIRGQIRPSKMLSESGLECWTGFRLKTFNIYIYTFILQRHLINCHPSVSGSMTTSSWWAARCNHEAPPTCRHITASHCLNEAASGDIYHLKSELNQFAKYIHSTCLMEMCIQYVCFEYIV